MARRPSVRIFSFEPEEDTRPTGGLQFADPSMQGFTSQVNTYDEPDNDESYYGGRRSNFGSPAPYAVTYGGAQQLRDMNRKKGVRDGSQDE